MICFYFIVYIKRAQILFQKMSTVILYLKYICITTNFINNLATLVTTKIFHKLRRKLEILKQESATTSTVCN